jgi:chromosomal replication initiation ATPase DnaA
MNETPEPTIAGIQAAVCSEFGISRNLLLSERRGGGLPHMRRVGMWLSVRLTSKTFPAIAREFHRDRSIVFRAVNDVDKCIFECNTWGTTAISLYRRFTSEADQLSLGGL